MSEPLPVPGGRFRRPDRALLTFVACTLALAVLASLATTVLIRYGSEGTVAPHRAVAPVAAGPQSRPTRLAPVPVDRVVGSFQSAVLSQVGTQSGSDALTLGDLLSPPLRPLPKPSESPDATLPVAVPTLPSNPPTPTPVPVPLPTPAPIVVALPRPLPDLVLFPGGLLPVKPTPLPIP